MKDGWSPSKSEASRIPLVGREEEVELLIRRWEQVKSGEGRVVSKQIGSEPHTRLRYFCSPHHQDSALYPFIAQLERAAGFARDDGPETKLDKLATLLGPAAEIGDVSLLVELLSLPGGNLFAPLELSPQRKKESRNPAYSGSSLETSESGLPQLFGKEGWSARRIVGGRDQQLAARRNDRSRDWMGRLAVPQSRKFRTSDADRLKGSGRKADAGGRRRCPSRISVSQHGLGQQQGEPVVRYKAAPMARRFGDIAPVQLERLIDSLPRARSRAPV